MFAQPPLPMQHKRNIINRNQSPIKSSNYTTPDDRNRIMQMHQIINGRKNNRSINNTPNKPKVSIQQAPRQLTPQRIIQNAQVNDLKVIPTQVNRGHSPLQGKVIMNPQKRYQQQAMVYCPVCQRNYPNSRTKQHIQIHLQPDPVLVRTIPINPVVTQVVTLPQSIPEAQTMMIVEPAEYIINDFFGGNNFYIVDNTQNLPAFQPVLHPQPQVHTNEEIIQQTYQSNINPNPTVNSSIRKSNHVVFEDQRQQQSFVPYQNLSSQMPQNFSDFNNHQSYQNNHNSLQQFRRTESIPLQTIQQQIITNSPHSKLTRSKHSSIHQNNGVPFINSIVEPYQSVHRSIVPNAISGHDSTYVPTYPVHYPMKKATTFNLFSCFDTIGHDSFVADGFIKQNDVYARPRY